jgi:hypothetical protein
MPGKTGLDWYFESFNAPLGVTRLTRLGFSVAMSSTKGDIILHFPPQGAFKSITTGLSPLLRASNSFLFLMGTRLGLKLTEGTWRRGRRGRRDQGDQGGGI